MGVEGGVPAERSGRIAPQKLLLALSVYHNDDQWFLCAEFLLIITETFQFNINRTFAVKISDWKK